MMETRSLVVWQEGTLIPRVRRWSSSRFHRESILRFIPEGYEVPRILIQLLSHILRRHGLWLYIWSIATTVMSERACPSPLKCSATGDSSVLLCATVVAIDQIYTHDPCLRKIWESSWIRILGTSYPSGMNLRVDSLWNMLDDHRRTRGFNVPSSEITRLWVSIIPQIDNNYIKLTINIMYFLMHGALAILKKADLRPKHRRGSAHCVCLTKNCTIRSTLQKILRNILRAQKRSSPKLLKRIMKFIS